MSLRGLCAHLHALPPFSLAYFWYLQTWDITLSPCLCTSSYLASEGLVEKMKTVVRSLGGCFL